MASVNDVNDFVDDTIEANKNVRFRAICLQAVGGAGNGITSWIVVQADSRVYALMSTPEACFRRL
jgi:hypothetical protein